MIVEIVLHLVFAAGRRPLSDEESVARVLSWVPPIDVSRDFAATEAGNVGLLPPIPACLSRIERASWSPDGSKILIVRQSQGRGLASPGASEEPLAELDAFNVRTGQSKSFWQFNPREIRIDSIGWMAGSGTALLETSSPTKQDPESSLISLHPRSSRIYLLDMDAQNAKPLVETKSSERATYAVSPAQPLAIVWIDPAEGAKRFFFVGPHGPVSLVKEVSGLSGETALTKLVFDSSGKHVLVRRWRGEGVSHDRLNPETGALEPGGQLRPYLSGTAASPSYPLKWKPLPSSVAADATRGVLSLVLPGVKPISLLVSADADATSPETMNGVPSISPDSRTLIYSSQGVGLTRAIVFPSPSQWAQMRSEWFRYRAMRDCAEVYSAFEGAVAENRGAAIDLVRWLKTNPEWPGRAGKFLANSGIASRFVRSEISSEADPSKGGKIEVGTASNGFGTARLYAHGTVVWIPKVGP